MWPKSAGHQHDRLLRQSSGARLRGERRRLEGPRPIAGRPRSATVGSGAPAASSATSWLGHAASSSTSTWATRRPGCSCGTTFAAPMPEGARGVERIVVVHPGRAPRDEQHRQRADRRLAAERVGQAQRAEQRHERRIVEVGVGRWRRAPAVDHARQSVLARRTRQLPGGRSRVVGGIDDVLVVADPLERSALPDDDRPRRLGDEAADDRRARPVPSSKTRMRALGERRSAVDAERCLPPVGR